jgi:hypothetical protein
MPATIGVVTYEPIKALRVASSQGNIPQLFRPPEQSLQTFKIGVPVMYVGGYVQELSTSAANIVLGVSAEQAHNYTTAGVPVDLNDPAAGPPPNQPNALVIPMGAAIRDGNIGTYGANGQTIFSIAMKLGQIFTEALLNGGPYGLTKDATSGFWFLDSTVTNGNSAVANLVGYDQPPTAPNDPVLGARVFFQFISNRRYFS